jgi:hypothetical protein
LVIAKMTSGASPTSLCHTARLLDRHRDLILVGASLGMAMHGLEIPMPEHDRLPTLAGADVGRGQPFDVVLC